MDLLKVHKKVGRKKAPARLCLVCGDVACGINYKIASCMSCKIFFRRNAHKSLICPFAASCTITQSTRRCCNACRLAKCFACGMQANMILNDEQKRQREEIRYQNRLKKKQSAHFQLDNSANSANICDNSSAEFLKLSSALDELCNQILASSDFFDFEEIEKLLADSDLDSSTPILHIVNFTPHAQQSPVSVLPSHQLDFLPPCELLPGELHLLAELNGATSILHNPYRRIEHFAFERPQAHRITESIFYRLIQMSRKLEDFRSILDEAEQEVVLKRTLIPMLMLQSVTVYNAQRNAWAMIDDSSQACVMFSLEHLKPRTVLYERHRNYASLFLDEWKSDSLLFGLLLAVLLFNPNNSAKLQASYNKHIRLLYRYLHQVVYKTNAEGFFNQLMNNLSELYACLEDSIGFFKSFREVFKQEPFYANLLDL